MGIILAFGHRQYMGKDTMARFVAAELRERTRGISIESRSFAFKLKQICHSLYGWAGLQLPEYYEQNPFAKNIDLPIICRSPRSIWIDVGNKLRMVDENIWIDSVLRSFIPDVLLIRDLRYPNEADKIHELGGYCVECFRPNYKDHGIEITDDAADIALEGYSYWDYRAASHDLKEAHAHAKVIVDRFCQPVLRN